MNRRIWLAAQRARRITVHIGWRSDSGLAWKTLCGQILERRDMADLTYDTSKLVRSCRTCKRLEATL